MRDHISIYSPVGVCTALYEHAVGLHIFARTANEPLRGMRFYPTLLRVRGCRVERSVLRMDGPLSNRVPTFVALLTSGLAVVYRAAMGDHMPLSVCSIIGARTLLALELQRTRTLKAIAIVTVAEVSAPLFGVKLSTLQMLLSRAWYIQAPTRTRGRRAATSPFIVRSHRSIFLSCTYSRSLHFSRLYSSIHNIMALIGSIVSSHINIIVSSYRMIVSYLVMCHIWCHAVLMC